ncbi:hypothetical protein [Actinophytocola sp.]|uniref:hypothetical protein n=1 Tax=Actinophytocola sp. TaxID=1872138 RepID=UPI00389AE755
MVEEARFLQLHLQVGVGPDGDADEVAEAALQVRRELLSLDVVDVTTPAGGEAPPGSRGLELAALGALVVTIAGSPLLDSLLDTVKSWLAGSHRRSIRLELNGDVLELTGVSSKEQRRLTEEWLRRNESRP